MNPQSVSDLSRPEQRRILLKTSIRCMLIFAVILGIYYLLPERDMGSAAAVVRLGIALLGFLAIMTWEVRRITRAEWPEVRAAESLATAVPLFLAIYATAYSTMSVVSPADFTEHMDRTAALYFAIVTFGTVGYGDITPTNDLARIIVSSQILGDFIMIGLLLRLLVRISQVTIQRAHASRGGHEAAPK